MSLAVIIPLFRNPDAEEPRPEPKEEEPQPEPKEEEYWDEEDEPYYCECGEKIDIRTWAAYGECLACYHVARNRGERN